MPAASLRVRRRRRRPRPDRRLPPQDRFLEIKSNLNGNSLKSASQVLGTATTDADSNAVLHLGGGVEIVLISVHASDLKADMIHMN